MISDNFLIKLYALSSSTTSIKRFKQLALDLAVSGRLLPQDAKDEHANVTLGKASEGLLPLPSKNPYRNLVGWSKINLGCAIKSNTGGGTPPRNDPSCWNGSIPWASVKDIGKAKHISATEETITQSGLDCCSSNLIPAGRLIVVTRMGLGKLAVNTVPMAINQDLRAIEPTEALDLNFAYLLFKSLKLVGSGVTVKGITVQKLHEIEVGLPPLAEQKRIVAKVDELMALCDRLEAQLMERDIKQAALAKAALAKFTEDPTPENLQLLFHPSFSVEPEDMRKAVLTLAINGRLTRNNPGATTATASFPIVPLGSLLTDGPTNGVSPKAVSHDTGVKSLSLSATTSGVFKGEHFKFVPLKVPADSNLWLKDGDLLIQRSNSLEKVGTSAIYRGKPNQFIDPDLMMKMRWSELADVDFVQLVLCEQRVRQYFRGKAVGTSGNMPKIGQETVRNTPIPLPNLDVQRAIVEKVKRLDSMIDQLKSQLEASRTTGEKLLEAMVAELTSA